MPHRTNPYEPSVGKPSRNLGTRLWPGSLIVAASTLCCFAGLYFTSEPNGVGVQRNYAQYVPEQPTSLGIPQWISGAGAALSAISFIGLCLIRIVKAKRRQKGKLTD